MYQTKRRVALYLALVTPVTAAINWEGFRGSNGSGISTATQPPLHFGAQNGVVWRTELPEGKSSPVVTKDRIFLTGHAGEELITLCLDRGTGKTLWRGAVKKARTERRNQLNDAAAPTPVTDGNRVIAFFSEFGLVSYDLAGKEEWRVPLGPFESEHGMATSPLLAGNAVILLADVMNDSFMAAFDAKTGEQLWRVKRPDTLGAYAMPSVYRPEKGPAQLVAPGPFEVAGYDLATGERLWWVRGLGHQPKSPPTIAGDVAYVNMRGWTGNYGSYKQALAQLDKDGDGAISQDEIAKWGYFARYFQGFDFNRNGKLDESEWNEQFGGEEALVAIRLDGRGDVSKTHVLWRHKKGLPQVPAPLLYQGRLYLVRDGGIVTSFDPASGAVVKEGRIREAIDTIYSSPVAAGGYIYFGTLSGRVVVLRAGPEWEKAAVNDLGDEIYATPFPDEERVFVRTAKALYCLKEAGEDPAPVISAEAKAAQTALAEYAGSYKNERGFIVKVLFEEGTLLFRAGERDYELVRVDGEAFNAQGMPQATKFVFERAEGGKIVSFTRSSTWQGKEYSNKLVRVEQP